MEAVRPNCATLREHWCLRAMQFSFFRTALPFLAIAMSLAMASSALAQEADEIRIHLEINEARMQAERLEEAGQFAACAHALISLYEEHQEDRRSDELLYNAAVCYEAALLPKEATRTLLLLESKFPSSALTGKALLRRANLAHAIADYEQSAKAYEVFARRYPGEREARAALENAVVFRLALGNHKEAIANLEMAIRFYGRKDRANTASAQLQIAIIYDDLGRTKDARRAYEQYLLRFGSKDTPIRRLMASAKLGILLWNASCPRRRADGLCVKQESVSKTSTPCSTVSTSKLVRIPRKKRLAEEARKYFRKALSIARGARLESGPRDTEEGDVGIWIGAVRFYLADDALEAHIGGLKAPPRPVFGTGPDSKEPWQHWVADQITAQSPETARLIQSYELVRGTTRASANWSIAAASRVGLITEEFSMKILQIEIPGKHTGDWAFYCRQLASKSAPLSDLAVGAYGFCHNLSTNLNWPNPWSRTCTERLGLLRPADFPPANEYHVPKFLAAYRQARVGILKEAR